MRRGRAYARPSSGSTRWLTKPRTRGTGAIRGRFPDRSGSRLTENRAAPERLFDSAGNFIAFRSGQYLFNSSCDWIGWLPWADADAVDLCGEYLGTIFPGARLYRRTDWLYRGYPGWPAFPGHPGRPRGDDYAGYARLPPGTEDVPAGLLTAGELWW